MPDQLSVDQARKLVLHSQRLPQTKQAGGGVAATLSAIEHLGYVQIDTLSVVQRAHHHTLWNRNPRYKPAHLDELVAGKEVFEYWSHAAAYLPMRDFRHSLFLKQRIASGEQQHWHVPDKRLMKSVVKRITDEGPLMAKDFENTSKAKPMKQSEWSTNPAKQALETLFMNGDLMITGRQKFHKIYDLSERVVPSHVDTTPPTQVEQARFLIAGYLRANGLGQPAEIAYLLKNVKPLVSDCLLDMVANGEVIRVCVGDLVYYALPDSLQLLSKPLSRGRLKILSPFDNLLIQRKRMQVLFGFDYMIECYVTKAKRQYGYFSLPILWDGRLVARMDCKADRKASMLHLLHLAMEPSLNKHDAFFAALQKELVEFAKFNDCNAFELHRTTPARYRSILGKVIRRGVGYQPE